MTRSVLTLLFALAFFCHCVRAGWCQRDAVAHDEAQTINVDKCLVIRALVRKRSGGRGIDVVASRLTAGQWKTPAAGQVLQLPGGETATWQSVTATEGVLRHPQLAGGYASITLPSERERVMILHATGRYRRVYVNGQPRVGDLYGKGYVRLPVLLQKGQNELLVLCLRDNLRATLVAPRSKALFNTADTTAPDLLVGQAIDDWAAVVVVNATNSALADLLLEATGDGFQPTTTTLPTLPALSTRKVAFPLRGPEPHKAGAVEVGLQLLRGTGDQASVLDTATIALQVRQPDQPHKRTFRSAIDGSVQYFAVNPARRPPEADATGGERPALFLTLHGAAVEALGQARAYAPKSWGHLVAPTNRRPYGFDWEDWGRLDAMEVLETAQRQLATDPRRTYLTGHSMGGHGVWHLGAVYPHRFAAIGPSAGWISFWSYTRRQRPAGQSQLDELLRRATSASDTLTLARNYTQHGVYILHGANDDNVPAGQARQMKQQLDQFHHDVVYHEQADAGHWWDRSDEPGADCVDWAPMFDFFARRIVPAKDSVRQVDFTTVSPGISAWCHWVGIEAQRQALKPSSVSIRYDPSRRRFSGTTENVVRLALDLSHVQPGEPMTIELDGGKIEDLMPPTDGERMWLRRDEHGWSPIEQPNPSLKGPHRYGPFKDAFRNRMTFVYATGGSPEENGAIFAKARFDAETFWYRGNGSVDIVPDADFDPAAQRDRNVVVYGNADTNSAWSALLAASPVQVHRHHVQLGAQRYEGSDLACLFIRPRPQSDVALVGVVAGTGLQGHRLTQQLTYLRSGVGFPDVVLLRSDPDLRGQPRVITAGFFGIDWAVASGELAHDVGNDG